MLRPRLLLPLVATFAVLVVSTPSAQHQLQPVAALRGTPAVELALRKLDTVGTLMMTTAHPDDENNAMLAFYGHGKGMRTTLVTATRGEGGQNEIGPELFEALAVLRTEELLAAHRYDGAEQYFTRAVDFGYSFSVEETLEKWGKEEILGDYVRMIRTIRPQVIVGFVFDGEGGGQHHQTSSRLTAEAFRAAADPARFPEQIKEGLRPWQASKFYYTAGLGGPGPGAAASAARPAFEGPGASSALMFGGGAQYDTVLGRTYNELAGEARSMHKCQGMSQLLPLPGDGGAMGPGSVRAYRLRDTVLADGVNRAEQDPFDGVDTSLASLAASAGANPPQALRDALATITAFVRTAHRELGAGGGAATVPSLTGGLQAVRELRRSLPGLGLSADARDEIDFRLAQKESQFIAALVAATDLRLEAIANDGIVTPGQTVNVQLIAAARGGVPVDVKSRVLNGFDQPTEKGGVIPANARPTAAHFKYAANAARFDLDPDVPFGLPFRPTPFTATFTLAVSGLEFPVTVPVQARSEGNLFSGEKRAELHVVPAFAVTASPDTLIVPTRATPANVRGTRKDVRVTVVNHAKGAAKGEVVLELPNAWRATPGVQPVTFAREDEAITVRFLVDVPPSPMLKPAAATPGGSQFPIRAFVRDGATTYAQGYQLVEYPHTTRRHVLVAPRVTAKAVDVMVKPNVTVGYVMGVGDEVPAALEQLGVSVSLIGPEELAWDDLSKYDVVMTGVRAYERRLDLRAYNQRLLDYAAAGGTVIVNYNKFEFNDAQYAPYPGRVGRERVTDENAEVRLLQPQHPVFNGPNTIGRADWTGWVQERGLYFFDSTKRDPHIQDLLEFEEPFAYNKGTKRGALVEAQVGKGRWIYVGLGLWRQLPAGTEGAFRLMANLVSLGTDR
ncbi:MAG: PIG-L family deacetylase [Acidobacteria bacterium]|nr:PIG-L family deacetylase [Acidobacteriota bacterium]